MSSDQDSSDYESVNLLMSSPEASVAPSPVVCSPICQHLPSPATQTLDQLSQSSLTQDLMLSNNSELLSRLEYNAVTLLTSVKNADDSSIQTIQRDLASPQKDTPATSYSLGKNQGASSSHYQASFSHHKTPSNPHHHLRVEGEEKDQPVTNRRQSRESLSTTASHSSTNHYKQRGVPAKSVQQWYPQLGPGGKRRWKDTFASLSDAQRLTGVNRRFIGEVCHGKRQLAGGFYWNYVEPTTTTANKTNGARANATSATTASNIGSQTAKSANYRSQAVEQWKEGSLLRTFGSLTAAENMPQTNCQLLQGQQVTSWRIPLEICKYKWK